MQREWTNTGDDYIDSLATNGDPLEYLICRDFEALNLVLQPYSKVWKNHILQRRVGGGAFLVDKWQEFGGRHYTALIRLHHAKCAKDEIIQLCSEIELEDYRRLLKVHSACATFWDNLGASIDNFMKARIEAKKLLSNESVKRITKEKCDRCGAEKQDSKFLGKTLSPVEYPKLDFAFQRRNQFIHSIIVPHQIHNGEIFFNLKHFDDETTKWSNEGYSKQELGSKIEEDWFAILKDFANAWEALYSYLQEHDLGSPFEQNSAQTWGTRSLKNISITSQMDELSPIGQDIFSPSPSGVSGYRGQD